MTEHPADDTGKRSGTSLNGGKSGMSNHLLIPVDFSESSMLAVSAGFHFAKTLHLLPVILHVYPVVWFGETPPVDYMSMYPGDADIQEAIEQRDIMKVAEHGMSRFRKRVEEAKANGSIPDVKYNTLLLEGIAEDVILDYCKQNNPRLVVMATRGIDKKEEDLIGSVTAEVLDSCRVPVFTVPDNYKATPDKELKRILMFCTLDQYDIIALENLINTFKTDGEEIWLMAASHRHLGDAHDRVMALKATLAEKWPSVKFHVANPHEEETSDDLDRYISRNRIDLIIAPNRKTSIFTRLFRPSVAHQCLFTLDLPMLALPVSRL